MSSDMDHPSDARSVAKAEAIQRFKDGMDRVTEMLPTKERDELYRDLARISRTLREQSEVSPAVSLEHAACERWQQMAEDLWEELQYWHSVDCPADLVDPVGECTCHNVLAAKWDELTHAADWDDDGEDDS